MKPIFSQRHILPFRFFLAALTFSGLLVSMKHSSTMRTARNYAERCISDIYSIVDSPARYYNTWRLRTSSHEKLIQENNELRASILLQKTELLELKHLADENRTLRELLHAHPAQAGKKSLARVLSITLNPYHKEIILDKGEKSGIFLGQSVLDQWGIVGQVVALYPTTSRALLLTDPSHAIPIQIVRNQLRGIAHGATTAPILELQPMPISNDIKVGDQLVSSGLGGKFPQGYPIGTIIAIEIDKRNTWLVAKVLPASNLAALNHVVLLWDKFPPSPIQEATVPNQ